MPTGLVTGSEATTQEKTGQNLRGRSVMPARP